MIKYQEEDLMPIQEHEDLMNEHMTKMEDDFAETLDQN